MITHVETLPDVLGQSYYGIKVHPRSDVRFDQNITNYIQLFKTIQPDYEQYIKAQKDRDSEGYHISVINVPELNQIIAKFGQEKAAEGLLAMCDIDIEYEMKGIGCVEKNDSKAYFVVVDCPQLNRFRTGLGLKTKDLHITLGFYPKDVFGPSKSIVSWNFDIDIFTWLKANLNTKVEYHFNPAPAYWTFIKNVEDWDTITAEFDDKSGRRESPDFENFQVLSLSDKSLIIELGGDWQNPVRVTIGSKQGIGISVTHFEDVVDKWAKNTLKGDEIKQKLGI